jgi:hypothetical protein
VVDGVIEDVVYRQLLKIVQGGDKVILSAGQDPNITQRTKRRS